MSNKDESYLILIRNEKKGRFLIYQLVKSERKACRPAIAFASFARAFAHFIGAAFGRKPAACPRFGPMGREMNARARIRGPAWKNLT
ncbi:MAG TPA: hypothetical protein VFW68_11470 [Rhodocyclaceae bacterium]|nr:hypothetical protein [Rhodocyclaceae bacterium]